MRSEEVLLQEHSDNLETPSNKTSSGSGYAPLGECVSPEARIYAVKELARRAGVTADFFGCWRIVVSDEETTVLLQPGTRRQVRFKHASPETWDELKAHVFHTTKASWMYPPPGQLKQLVPDFVIPFCSASSVRKPEALFHRVDENRVECGYDLPLSALLTLSRFEEMLPTRRDAHGRFAASQSLAFSEDFLNRPIVDEYGLAFEQALRSLLPVWQPVERTLRIKLSHDVDDVGLPFSLRSACGHTIRRHHLLATMRDLLYPICGLTPTYLKLVEDVARMALERGLKSAVYWKASPPGPHDTGYNPEHPLIRKAIEWLRDRGVEMGLHAGYETFLYPDRLLQEAQTLSEALGEWPGGGRQHYLRWCPQTWVDWETCKLSPDSSLGYADQIGFRAGTCLPYRPWLLTLNREANLIEIPLLVMDATLMTYLHLLPKQSLARVADCMARSRAVGGVFTVLWHNSTLLDPGYDGLYKHLLDRLGDFPSLDCRTVAQELY